VRKRAGLHQPEQIKNPCPLYNPEIGAKGRGEGRVGGMKPQHMYDFGLKDKKPAANTQGKTLRGS